jgi:nitroimidazol reductase NimA-like FMN-containing flavoprotein (pyridoxamine 5'-phosphate oxidase superfamily)
MPDLAAYARRIIDAHVYMTLATADAEGRPWVSPVWFAHEDHTRFVWVSRPERRHSRNLAERPQASIVIFDSTPRPQAPPESVYVEAEAEQVAGADEERCVESFSRRSEALGWPALSLEDVRPPAALRIYRATASAIFVLDENDDRIAVDLAG